MRSPHVLLHESLKRGQVCVDSIPERCEVIASLEAGDDAATGGCLRKLLQLTGHDPIALIGQQQSAEWIRFVAIESSRDDDQIRGEALRNPVKVIAIPSQVASRRSSPLDRTVECRPLARAGPALTWFTRSRIQRILMNAVIEY